MCVWFIGRENIGRAREEIGRLIKREKKGGKEREVKSERETGRQAGRQRDRPRKREINRVFASNTADLVT